MARWSKARFHPLLTRPTGPSGSRRLQWPMEARMRHRFTATFVLTFALAGVSGAGAETLSPQVPGTQAAPATPQVIHHVALRDGSQLYGVIVSEDATSI